MDGAGCLPSSAFRYGREPLSFAQPERCGDCGTRQGQYHHVRCCWAMCARCGDQQIAHDWGEPCVPLPAPRPGPTLLN